jgi:ankyrin repeat protein
MLKRLCMSMLLVISCGYVGAMAALPALHGAAKAGDLLRVQGLIAANRSVIDQPDELGRTPLEVALLYSTHGLCIATSTDYQAVAQILILAGANVNYLSSNGWTFLHRTALYGYQAVAKDLIAAGANVDRQDDDGNTPLHFALFGCEQGAVQNLIAQDLIAAGANLDIKNKDNLTPLQYAQSRKNQSMVDLLTDYQERKQAAKKRAHDHVVALAMATHPRLVAGSPLAMLDQNLLRCISELAKEAELLAARQPKDE